MQFADSVGRGGLSNRPQLRAIERNYFREAESLLASTQLFQVLTRASASSSCSHKQAKPHTKNSPLTGYLGKQAFDIRVIG
jgi:hypothetical protein